MTGSDPGQLVDSIRAHDCYVKYNPERFAWLQERGWVVSERDAKEDAQPYLQAYYDEHNNLRVPQSYKAPDGFNLGHLVASIRSSGCYVKGHPERLCGCRNGVGRQRDRCQVGGRAAVSAGVLRRTYRSCVPKSYKAPTVTESGSCVKYPFEPLPHKRTLRAPNVACGARVGRQRSTPSGRTRSRTCRHTTTNTRTCVCRRRTRHLTVSSWRAGGKNCSSRAATSRNIQNASHGFRGLDGSPTSAMPNGGRAKVPASVLQRTQELACAGDVRRPRRFQSGQLVASIQLKDSYVKGHPDRLAWLNELGGSPTRSMPSGRTRRSTCRRTTTNTRELACATEIQSP